jgi:hypothetical protein
MRWQVVGGVVLAARVASAAPCEVDAAAIRAHLVDEAARERRWDLGWGIGLGGAAVGQLALGLSGAFDRDLEQAMYVGAGKSAIGSLGHFILPLKIEVPPPAADACADLAALRAAMATTAHHERQTFWINHVGALVLNGAGAIVLGERTNWTNAAVSFVTGYAVGVTIIYTQPRGTWHAMALPADHGGLVGIAAQF